MLTQSTNPELLTKAKKTQICSLHQQIAQTIPLPNNHDKALKKKKFDLHMKSADP